MKKDEDYFILFLNEISLLLLIDNSASDRNVSNQIKKATLDHNSGKESKRKNDRPTKNTIFF